MDYTNDMVNELVNDIEDIPEDSTATYEVWAIGYNSDDTVTDAEMLIGEFTDPDEAVECAKQLTLADIIHQAAEEDNGAQPAEDVAYISVEVETVVADEDEGTMNVGTIYKKELLIDGGYICDEDSEDAEEPDPIMAIAAEDYTLLEDGTLKVRCDLLKDFNKNDYVRFQFLGETESCLLTYKIMSKVMYADGDYYHCEFMY